MSELHAEVEYMQRATITVRVEKYCAHYAEQRATFDGTDAEFAEEGLRAIGPRELIEGFVDNGDGVESTVDYDDYEIRIYGA